VENIMRRRLFSLIAVLLASGLNVSISQAAFMSAPISVAGLEINPLNFMGGVPEWSSASKLLEAGGISLPAKLWTFLPSPARALLFPNRNFELFLGILSSRLWQSVFTPTARNARFHLRRSFETAV
jgi:hypothetical protein